MHHTTWYTSHHSLKGLQEEQPNAPPLHSTFISDENNQVYIVPNLLDWLAGPSTLVAIVISIVSVIPYRNDISTDFDSTKHQRAGDRVVTDPFQ
jgi:hypothetical protein